MKKLLLPALTALLVAGSSAAMEPTVFPGMAFHCLSPDGNYAVSYSYSVLNIFDFQADKSYAYEEQYGIGNGNYVSNTGIVVGYKDGFNSASMFQNGEWYDLPGVEGHFMSFANGITSNGARIVGTVSPDGMEELNVDGLMLVPCYWDRQADGKYSQPVYLPHPDTDLTGRVPQYVTAVRVSEDGKTIAGQIQDFSGMICQPIVYTQDASGEWSYTLVLDDLFHIKGFTLPEDPGEAPSTDPTDFMTQEELAAYQQALQDWENECEESGEWNYETYPSATEYLSETGKEALAKAEEEYAEWAVKSDAYIAAFEELRSKIPAFEYNNVFLSTDAKWYATSDVKSEFNMETWEDIKEYTPYLIDISNLNNVTYTKFPNDQLNVTLTSMADDGTLLGQVLNADYITQAYILPQGSTEFVSVYDYINAQSPELGQWMKENMTHTYMAFDYETFESVEKTDMFSGMPFTTPDLSLFAFAVENGWYDWDNADAEDAEPYIPVYGYMFSTNMAGVESIETESAISLSTLPNATISLKGDVDYLRIYNINGSCVFSCEHPATIVATGLSKGIYIVKATGANGREIVRKVVL